jgi:hypothetical protein
VATWWEYLVGFVILVHGLGHLTGVGVAFARASASPTDQLGIFSRVIRYQSPLGKGWAVIWLAAAGCLVAAAIGLMNGQSWWRVPALVGVFASLTAILPWWELWNPTRPEQDCPLLWPLTIARWWNTVAPVARAGLVLDFILLAALVLLG